MNHNKELVVPLIIKKRIDDKVKKLDSYRLMASSISAAGLEEKVMTSKPNSPPYVAYIEKIDSLERELIVDRKLLEEVKARLDDKIDRLESLTEQTVLRYRYLMFMNNNQIGDLIGYSAKWVQKIHLDGLKHFENCS